MAARSMSGYPATHTRPRPGEWISYSSERQALLLADLASGRNLGLDRTRLGGYSRQMERRLYVRAGDVAALIRRHLRPGYAESALPWRWSDLPVHQQAERLRGVADWARWRWTIPAYDAGTRQIHRELASAAMVVADRLDPRPRVLDR